LEGTEQNGFVRGMGVVVLDSFHPASFLTGVVLSAPLFLGGVAAANGASPLLSRLAVLSVFPLTLLVQSRLAANSFAGDSAGGLFSKGGGGAADVLQVFARLLALTLAWAVPLALMIWAWVPRLPAVGRLALSFEPPPSPILVIYLGTGLIVPFFFLPAAVAASGLGEVFSSGFWRGVFGGRLGEAFLMLLATAGAPLAVGAVLAPWLAALALKVPDVAAFLASVAALYVAGVTISVHAKLCGSFAASVLVSVAEESSTPVVSAHARGASDGEVQLAWNLFPTDPEGALARMAALAAAPVAEAKVFYALASMRRQAGDGPGALEAARQAIPLCLRANEGKLAVELFKAHVADARDLWLDHDQLTALGDLFFTQSDLASAANAWAAALNADAGDRKAFKGLLKIADQILQSGESLDRAIRVYDYLVQRSPDSPFADHARAQLDIARRRAAKA
jgi:hypothetical protein